MEEFATSVFKLNQPAAKGSKITKRQSLEHIQTTRRRRDPSYTHPELALADPPQSVAYLWAWFLEVQTGSVLTWQEIRAWQEIMKNEITPPEAKVLRKLSMIQNNISTENQQ